MDGIGPVGQRGVDDPVDPQVALVGRGWPDADRHVGQPRVHRLGIRVAVDGDRLDAQFVAGADDPHRDLATVRDEDATERQLRLPHSAGRVFAQRRGCGPG